MIFEAQPELPVPGVSAELGGQVCHVGGTTNSFLVKCLGKPVGTLNKQPHNTPYIVGICWAYGKKTYEPCSTRRCVGT